MNADVIIIGAGASGLMAAIAAAKKGSSVLVIEYKDKAGKKILATGNGKCNFTNLLQSADCYRSDDSTFAMKVLSHFDVRQTILFFTELGIYPKEEHNGYLYPNSMQAASIVQVLLMECERLGVKFVYEEKAVEIKQPYFTVITEVIENTVKPDRKADQKSTLKLSSDNTGNNKNYNKRKSDHDTLQDQKSGSGNSVKRNVYYGKKLILSTGGCASPKLGSDGSGYALAKSFGHKLIKPLPVLVQLKASDKYCKTVSGTRTDASVTAFSGTSVLAKEEGEIIFTDYGISGIPILQISRFVAKALDKKEKIHLEIDFLPQKTQEEIIIMLDGRKKLNPAKTLEQMMIGLFNNKLSYVMIKEAELDPYKMCGDLNQREITELSKQIKKFHMTITDTNSFDNAQVCAGGVPTGEVDDKTMESKIIKNLFLTGELVDVDGTCGGYNLQWAWSTGFVAGSAAGSRN